MKKMYTKLMAITLLLILSGSMVVMSTFAWFVMSRNPVATGIQVSIGGGNTVMVAPDLTQVVNGQVCHYPGRFTQRMHFGQYESYDYLKELGGLTPVSTADGVHWFLPAYYDGTEEAVQNGQVPVGQLKELQAFVMDTELSHANLKASEKRAIQEGSYLYLDFWVVSNSGDLTLRLSSLEEGNGTFLIDLPAAVEADTLSGYALEQGVAGASASVRVGFLTNDIGTGDQPMLCYQSSPGFDSRYTGLRGFYQEKSSGVGITTANHFAVYEPNCDSHPADPEGEGSYIPTRPLAWVDGVITPVSLPVAAQTSARWMPAEHGEDTALAQRFQAAVMGMDLKNMTPRELQHTFYGNYLQGQLSPYIQKGSFVASAGSLDQPLTAEEFSQQETAGVTRDVQIVHLERYIPQRIRMFIWLEGQDVDCVNAASTSSFALELELAGGSE